MAKKEKEMATMQWHTMDEEPLMCGVILYSRRYNCFYDASYIGGGKFIIDKSNFDRWYQREYFFKDSGLSESLNRKEE